MASIHGLTIKSLKCFNDHEGAPIFQGNVYLGTKKLGFWSQDSWGGPDIFHFDDPKIEKKLNERIKELNPDKATHGVSMGGEPYTIDYDLEFLLFDLVKLLDDEKTFKKAIKNDYSGILIVTDSYHEITWSLPKSYLSLPDEELLSHMKKTIDKAKKEAQFFKETDTKKHEVKIYRDLSDFQIGKAITPKELGMDVKTKANKKTPKKEEMER